MAKIIVKDYMDGRLINIKDFKGGDISKAKHRAMKIFVGEYKNIQRFGKHISNVQSDLIYRIFYSNKEGNRFQKIIYVENYNNSERF
jgi:hypothetical protein